jgi:hypothetical protein
MGNLFGGFHVVCQIIDYTLKLMEILFKGLWGYLCYVTTKINFVCHSQSLSIYFFMISFIMALPSCS